MVRVKICGITTPADAALAAQLGADAIGLNFYPSSPRYITGAQASDILAALPPFVEPVALFVNESPVRAHACARDLGIATMQLHGDHEPASHSLRVIPAFPVRDTHSLVLIVRYLAALRSLGSRVPPAILVDAHVPGMHGGTGQTAPWQLLANFDPGVPLILAGGLTPDNVAEAIRIVRPYAVDVASGVESAPGRKDAEKMRRFIENARAAL